MSRGVVVVGLLGVLVCLPISGGAQALRRTIGWEFFPDWPRDGLSFLVTAVASNGAVETWSLPPSAPGACVGRLPVVTATTLCGILPCPLPGLVVTYWMQAVQGDEQSLPSPLVRCWLSLGARVCSCEDVTQMPPGLPRPGEPPRPPPPPDLDLSVEHPPLPQQSAEGLDLWPIGVLPVLAVLPAIPVGTAM